MPNKIKSQFQIALNNYCEYTIRYMEDMSMVWNQEEVDHLFSEVERLGKLYEEIKNEEN